MQELCKHECASLALKCASLPLHVCSAFVCARVCTGRKRGPDESGAQVTPIEPYLPALPPGPSDQTKSRLQLIPVLLQSTSARRKDGGLSTRAARPQCAHAL